MGEKLKIGMFGQFEWTAEIDVKCKSGRIIKSKQPRSIEGAKITDIDSKGVYLSGSDGAVYIAPRKGVVYTAMPEPEGIFESNQK